MNCVRLTLPEPKFSLCVQILERDAAGLIQNTELPCLNSTYDKP